MIFFKIPANLHIPFSIIQIFCYTFIKILTLFCQNNTERAKFLTKNSTIGTTN